MSTEKKEVEQNRGEDVMQDWPQPDEQAAKAIKKDLQAEFPLLWDLFDEAEVAAAYDFAESYRQLLSRAKTERLFVNLTIDRLQAAGFRALRECDSLKAGDRVYHSIKGKGLMAAVIGSQPAEKGYNLLGAHIDSPRADLKPQPVYEDGELSLLQTHYYGGIKKYQWTAIPLAIHGVAVRQDGSAVEIHIGEAETDPVFTIPELLIHLSDEQLKRVGNRIVQGEELNVLLGSRPLGKTPAEGRIKLAMLYLLKQNYGLTEKDLASAELEITPAGPARDIGLDRSFIGGYGQDDRVCAYPAIRALLQLDQPEKTCIVMLSDKEEIGSDGNTGAQSRLYENVIAEIFVKQSGDDRSFAFRRLLEESKMLSADVTNGFDPTYADVSDRQNTAYMGKGICLNKYTGSRGKYDASDANAEFMSSVVRTFNEQQIPWQTGLMGKVDIGGGGTICKYMANMGMEVLDCGVPVLSMHAPFEVCHKLDIYGTYMAYKCFLENM